MDIFVSYSSEDKAIAAAACAALESSGFRCWIAPRDELVQLAKRLDSNGDNSVSESELLAFGQTAVEYRDTDGDGDFDVLEFKKKHHNDGGAVTRDSLNMLFRLRDINQDGYVTSQEMERFTAAKWLGND